LFCSSIQLDAVIKEKFNFFKHFDGLKNTGLVKKLLLQDGLCRDRARPCPNLKADSHPANGGIPTKPLLSAIKMY
jgi:hypothetical protein